MAPEPNAQPQGAAAQPASETAQDQGLLDRIVTEARVGETEDERKTARDWVQAFLDQVAPREAGPSRSLDAMIAGRIAEIDQRLSTQLNEILHAPDFQQLEASWRGLHYLVDQTETSTTLKIKVLNVSKSELANDLKNAVEFDQSWTFKKIYEEEYGMLGGNPFGLLVGDYEFGRGPADVEVLDKMSKVAAAAHAPFIAAASAKMFGWDSFTELGNNRDLAKIFENDLYVPWRSFRESEDSRYVGLALPHVLMRAPYGAESNPVEAFPFEEGVDGKDHSKYLWGNAAYALAVRITDAFAKYEWCAAIRGVEGGGLVEGLPAHTFQTDEGDVALKCPTELGIGDRRQFEFAKLGFIPLCHHKGSDKAVFFDAQSCQKPKQYFSDEANSSAQMSTQLQYILAVSRFAHFLKAMMRDKIGSFTSQSKLQDDLNSWISNYVLLDDNAGQEQKARFPLREARIEVNEIAGKPGAYNAVAFLRPHYQLNELSVALRLVAKVPAPKS